MTINELDVHMLILSDTPAMTMTYSVHLWILHCNVIRHAALRSTLGHPETSVVRDVTLHSPFIVSFESKRNKVSQLLLYGRIFDTVLCYTYSIPYSCYRNRYQIFSADWLE